MKRPNMLSATFVKTVKTPGRYGDGRGGIGLSLLVRTAAGGHITKCWTQSVWIDQGPHQHRPRMLSGRDSRPARPRALENARGIAEGRDPRRVAEQQRAGHPPGRAAASLRWARRSRRCGARARTGARCSRRAFPADASTTRCWMPPARRTSPARARDDDAEAMRDMGRFARRVRRRLGLTQVEFARRIDVPHETIRNWERGKREPTGPPGRCTGSSTRRGRRRCVCSGDVGGPMRDSRPCPESQPDAQRTPLNGRATIVP